MPTIWGDIQFGEPAPSLSGATVRVRILDVSLADGPSAVVAESILPRPASGAGAQTNMPYSISCPELAENRSYSVWVHVDHSGDSNVSSGDFITMQSYPVSSTDTKPHIDVRVERVP
jgi:uncharacterized lipoprotein YbaY